MSETPPKPKFSSLRLMANHQESLDFWKDCVIACLTNGTPMKNAVVRADYCQKEFEEKQKKD